MVTDGVTAEGPLRVSMDGHIESVADGILASACKGTDDALVLVARYRCARSSRRPVSPIPGHCRITWAAPVIPRCKRRIRSGAAHWMPALGWSRCLIATLLSC